MRNDFSWYNEMIHGETIINLVLYTEWKSERDSKAYSILSKFMNEYNKSKPFITQTILHFIQH